MAAHQLNIGDSRVIESREVGDGKTIRRRREAPDGTRFTTYERIERPNLAVIKKDGSRELFDRDKLASAIKQSVGKFFSSELEVENIINSVEDAIYDEGESEIFSKKIGQIVLDKLEVVNQVAYVRFASVFHSFKNLDDFVRILANRDNEDDKKESK
ncbi:transcriptional repressor NrdR [Candidatus Nomurabacteria bacterium]|nr:transcriptional repressor NrdR [Candidatus Nomurabacteria bacterium]